jgi:hypothetical protein
MNMPKTMQLRPRPRNSGKQLRRSDMLAARSPTAVPHTARRAMRDHDIHIPTPATTIITLTSPATVAAAVCSEGC